MATYSNPFHSPHYQGSTPTITADAEPEEYKGHLIYQRNSIVWDIVKDGVCVGMYAGPNGARGRVDQIVGATS